jgi:hypothetical protein
MLSSARRVARFDMMVSKIQRLRLRDSVARSTHFWAWTAKIGLETVAAISAQSLMFMRLSSHNLPTKGFGKIVLR